MIPKEEKPWGFYEILDDNLDHKVKRITLYAGKRLSYQKHKYRSEHWFIVSGGALITIDGKNKKYHSGSSVNIPYGKLHRIKNISNLDRLVFIEIQTGSYFGEDDIERIEDDFNRV